MTKMLSLATLLVAGVTLTATPGIAQQQQEMTQAQQMGRECPLFIGPQGVEMVQEQLQAQGYDIDVDGLWGPETIRAAAEFQQQQGLPVSGVLTFRTRASLGVDFQQMAAAEAAQEPMDQQQMPPEQQQ